MPMLHPGPGVNRFDTESLTSKRPQSIGEVLSKMQPEVDEDEVDRRMCPPVDFSFREARSLSEFPKLAPRDSAHPYVTVPLDLTGQEVALVVKGREKKDEKGEGETKQFCKYITKAIRLSNNLLTSLDGLNKTLSAVVECADTLEWIDLSFNYITHISENILEYKNVKVLYLHANAIEDIREINKLAALPQLKTLTLHGNYIDGEKGYRQYVVSVIPQLQYLDFSRITRADRDKAVTWSKLKIIGPKRKKKKKVEE